MNQPPQQKQNLGNPGTNTPAFREEMEYLCAGERSFAILCLFPSLNKLYIIKDCGAKNEIKSREPIRCRECGHRIMYKKRTKRSTFRRLSLQYTALIVFYLISGAIRSSVTKA
jgi:DNA-directed RNA polymerase subunit RPC12/RpoP